VRLLIRIMATVVSFLFAWKAVTQIAVSDLSFVDAVGKEDNTFALVFLASCIAILFSEPRT